MYEPSNPPTVIAGPLASFNTTEAPATPRLWLYSSADPIATVQGANYIANGIQLGMRVGDIVFVSDTNLNRAYLTIVVSTTPAPAASTAYQGAGQGAVSLSNTSTPAAY
jgi:hypothetical protein